MKFMNNEVIGDSLYCFSKQNHKIYYIDRDEFFDEERHLIADFFEEMLSKCVYDLDKNEGVKI